MRLRAGIFEASSDPVSPGRWCTFRVAGSDTSVLEGADASLLLLEAWKRWVSPENFAAEPRRDIIYRG